MILEYKGIKPRVSDAIYIADNAVICGDVTLAEDTTIWFSAVIRADCASVTIGKGSNVQDNCTVHVAEGYPVVIGENVSVGHNAVVHGCTIEDDVLIGMNSTIMNGAVIGKGSIVAAGALVLEGTHVPPYSVVAGIPAKVKKTLDPSDHRTVLNSQAYVVEGHDYVEHTVEVE